MMSCINGFMVISDLVISLVPYIENREIFRAIQIQPPVTPTP